MATGGLFAGLGLGNLGQSLYQGALGGQGAFNQAANQNFSVTTGACTSHVIWDVWCQGPMTSSASTQVWPVWNEVYYPANAQFVQPALTPEQTRELHRHQQEYLAARAAEITKQQEASHRAAALLADHLAPEQRETFRKDRHFVVHSRDGQRRYRVEYGVAGNIKLLNAEGKSIAKFCIHPVDSRIPTEDVMLSQKLMIEGDEESFLRIANRTALAA